MTGWIAAGVMLAAAVAVVLLARWRSARLIRRLDAMLTAAMEGDFSETSFDESRLSALESRMARYLAASTLSARNLQTQKDQISALISDISHQTRTPVANLQLYAQLLEEQPLTPQGQRCAQAIAAQSEKLQTLMEALVKSSRLETGLLTLHPEPGQLAPMVERAAAQYAPKAQAKQIRLTVGRTDGGALFDPKWTEEAGRFYRAPGTYQAEGLGIGLYLTRQIAAGQGGYVRVKSAPGQGSTFNLSKLSHSGKVLERFM